MNNFISEKKSIFFHKYKREKEFSKLYNILKIRWKRKQNVNESESISKKQSNYTENEKLLKKAHMDNLMYIKGI